MKSSRIIINVRDGISDESAMFLVHQVILKGNVSKTRNMNHYCHAVIFASGIVVTCTLTRAASLRFDVYQDKPAKVKV